ncbi:MAG: rhodanese-like domain-containing protein [Candidatus Aenigmarchaeota archaeon]|nr:rhodanese-like domain-containing protein [Candidatus Aenigmarchaeota archaeon]
MNFDYFLHPSRILALAVMAGVMSGAITSLVILNTQPGEDKLIEDFYLTENAVHVSPHSLRGKMDKGVDDYVLVDLRSQEEYEKEHIVGAVNIPAYKDKDTSDYGAVDRIVGAFAALPKDKDTIVYCYSMPCMTGRKVGLMLAEHGIYVKHLGIGWNEWRYFWNLWNHEHEWNATDAENYIARGKEPGAPKTGNGSTACPISGDFGC